jgi:hypothetical protein
MSILAISGLFIRILLVTSYRLGLVANSDSELLSRFDISFEIFGKILWISAHHKATSYTEQHYTQRHGHTDIHVLDGNQIHDASFQVVKAHTLLTVQPL